MQGPENPISIRFYLSCHYINRTPKWKSLTTLGKDFLCFNLRRPKLLLLTYEITNGKVRAF